MAIHAIESSRRGVREQNGASSSHRPSARCSSGTTFTLRDARAIFAALFFPSGNHRCASPASRPMPRASWCAPSGPWCLAESAISVDVSTPSSSRFSSWGSRPRPSVCCRRTAPSAWRRPRSSWCFVRARPGVGGEYGGAATYVAEHAPDEKRGLHTSWIQTTASLRIILLSLVVIGSCRLGMAEPTFNAAGAAGRQ